MGQFSWLDCITGEQVIDGRPRKSYVLVPRQFGGGHIEEGCYEGYGVFGGHDVYDLVAEWNREYIGKPEKPDRSLWSQDERGDAWYEAALKRWQVMCEMMDDFKAGRDDITMSQLYHDDWKRYIGIEIACHDEDNANLRYPIKITHDPNAVYEWCAPSKGDPNQGWLMDDDDEWDDDEW